MATLKHNTTGCVIIYDAVYRMPLMDGFEVLKWVRRQPRFANLRVVVLTGSEEKRAASYEHGADSFMVKPLDSIAAGELSRSIERPLLAN
jgi:CheY-like chemotaxis protein